MLPNLHVLTQKFSPYPYKTTEIHKRRYINSTYITIIQLYD